MYRVLCKPGEAWVLDPDELLVAVFYGPDRQPLAYQYAAWRERIESGAVPAPDVDDGTYPIAVVLPVAAVLGLIVLAIGVAWRIAGGEW